MRASLPSPARGGRFSNRERADDHFDLAAPAFASFRQSDRNFLRSLPCKPFSSARFEHSIDSGLCGFSAFLAGAAAGVEDAGAVVVCAEAVPAKSSEAMATTAARDVIVIMEAPSEKEKGAQPRAAMMNRA